MKRLSAILLVTLLLVVLVSTYFVPVASADVSEYGDAYKAFTYFATKFTARTVGTENELSAANWLAKQLYHWGYSGVDGAASYTDLLQPFSFTYTDTVDFYDQQEVAVSSYNVVAYKRCGKDNAPLLVIAAPFSNEYALEVDGKKLAQEDAGYSATSVGTLLSVAVKLESLQDMSYDVALAFMGAEYFGFAGTKEFIKSNTQPIIGAIYLSQIGIGDHLNVYYDEVDTKHGAYADGVIAKWQFDIEGKPFDPGYYSQVFGGDLPYAHIGIAGGNYLFMQDNIPSLHLFGYNWVGGVKSSESAANDDIVYTDDDSYSNFVRLYGEEQIKARLDTASEFVKVLVFDHAAFSSALEGTAAQTSYHGLINDAARLGFRWSAIGVTVLAVVLAALLLMRKSQNAGLPDFSVNSQSEGGREQPSRENTQSIFGEYGSDADSDAITGALHVDGDSESDQQDNNTGNPPDTNDIFGEF